MARHPLWAPALGFAAPNPSVSREPHWPPSLVPGTASAGGTNHAYGEGLAQILTREFGLPVITRPTEGPARNILLLETGEIQLGFVTQGVALQAWTGSAAWTGGKPLRAMRAMFPRKTWSKPAARGRSLPDPRRGQSNTGGAPW